jgi:hypothetical protein
VICLSPETTEPTTTPKPPKKEPLLRIKVPTCLFCTTLILPVHYGSAGGDPWKHRLT